ncbi:hypothetical protein J3E74DRAFT_347198 [Bipolaris maydis]|nr:hypothetical protein J3E74DRAFT_347198 [Bipolaris maydis]
MHIPSLARAARIILVGAPGVGKGTQTERLMHKFSQLSAISSGDLLRKECIKAESTMKSGKLVPDTMILRLIVNELTTRGWIRDNALRPYALNFSSMDMADTTVDSVMIPSEVRAPRYTFSNHPSASFILDGFPRTAVQAIQLDNIVPINMVVHLNTPRRVYNTTFNAPKVPGKDDVTGEPLTRRADDDPERPLLEHYDKLGVLWTVNGNSSDEISPKLFNEFGKRFGAEQ